MQKFQFPQESQSSRRWLPAVTACSGMLSVGMIFAVQGPILPFLLEELNLSYTVGGTIGLCGALAYMAIALFSGYLSDRYGSRKGSLAGMLLLGGGVVSMSWSSAVSLLCGFRAAVGFGNAFIEVNVNKTIALAYPERRTQFMNLLYASWGLGALAAPLYAGFMMAHGWSWRATLAGTALLPCLTLALNCRRDPESCSRTLDRPSVRELFSPFLNSRLSYLYLVLLMNIVAQQGIILWLVNFLKRHHGLDTVTSALALSAFFAGLTGGRLLAFIGHSIMARGITLALSGMIMTVSLMAALFEPAFSVPVFFVCGAAFSPAFPILTSMTAERSPQRPGIALGGLLFAQSIGSAIGMWSIGFLNDWYGLPVGFSGIIAAAAVYTMLALRLWRWRPAGHSVPNSV